MAGRSCGVLLAAVAAAVVQRASAQNYYLYDSSVDPNDEFNLYDSDDHADVVTHMAAAAEELAASMSVPFVLGPDESALNEAVDWADGKASWLNEMDPRENVTQLYNHSQAPNIVMLVVDDWGWNSIGYQSNFMNWTTPYIDAISGSGIRLSEYHTHYYCPPSRAAILTGRYSSRIGIDEAGASLPLDEVTIGEELQSAGYRTWFLGKWFAGFASPAHQPVRRGFDYYYGFWGSGIGVYNKASNGGRYLDLHENANIVTDPAELSEDMHISMLLGDKAAALMEDHKENYAGQPFFLFHSTHLMHTPWEAPPDKFMAACKVTGGPQPTENQQIYCAMNILLDEVVHNLTCKLEELGFADNTVFVLTSDNGGSDDNTVTGTNYPFVGKKSTLHRGGTNVPAFVYSPLIPPSARGSTFNGMVHVTDWLPTFMGLATNNEWSGGYLNNTIDGLDVWESMTTMMPSPRNVTLHYADPTPEANDDRQVSYQEGDWRYIVRRRVALTTVPEYVFHADGLADSGIDAGSCSIGPPTIAPAEVPSDTPSEVPSKVPTEAPTAAPSAAPSEGPAAPTDVPTEIPTEGPTSLPTVNVQPTHSPSLRPSREPSESPTPGVVIAGARGSNANRQLGLVAISSSVCAAVLALRGGLL
jgi:arylsulfatase A-like enzyme